MTWIEPHIISRICKHFSESLLMSLPLAVVGHTTHHSAALKYLIHSDSQWETVDTSSAALEVELL